MNETQLNELLRAIFAPWDEHSWENFREAYPTQAQGLEAAVAEGLTAERILDFCGQWGYPPRIGQWMAQAVLHLSRTTAGRPGRASVMTKRGRAIHDADPNGRRADRAIRDTQPGPALMEADAGEPAATAATAATAP